ncbi:cupin domain-containing protein [Neobacillus vireti]|uniref:cupin domain-containing protein n=1 Tax=Neobacillus vireti TaxID=220686 RepID=UPI002FFE4395
MRRMYHNPLWYQYPYYINTPIDNSNFMRNQGNPQKLYKTILARIEKEVSAIEFYSTLAKMAPDQKQKNEILQVLEDEKAHFQQLSNLYYMATGMHPVYQTEKIPIHNFQEGVRKAYEAKLADYEEYKKGFLLSQNPPVQDVFLRASTDELEHAKRLSDIQSFNSRENRVSKDHGPEPYVVNIETATTQNNTFRTALWTGQHLQVTLMSIDVGGDIGLEIHPDVDQFLRIEQGQGRVQMGKDKNQLNFEKNVSDNFSIMVPAGTWHNVTNTGSIPLRLYSIYAPPEHPHGTVHKTKAEAEAAE